MKLKLFIVALFCSALSWAQTTLYSENFGTTAVFPTGWTSSNTTAGWNASTASVSGVYAGASAGTNIVFNGTGTNGVSHTLTYANNLSTVGYSNITVIWGARSTGTFAAAVTFQWSSDGATWNNVSFTNVAANSTWALVNGGVRITLPAGSEGLTNLRFRWTSTSTNSGNHRIDDFSVQGTPASSNTITTNTAISGSPFCVNSSTSASVSVPFTSTGTFTGNTYTAQLSNAAGSFASPVSIGTLVSDANSGTISATIPTGTVAGTGYRIRVVSNNPTVFGTNNTVDLTVQNSAVITAQPSTSTQTMCQGVGATALSVTATGTTLSYQWYSNTTATNSGGTPVGTNSASYTPSTATAGTLYYYCVVTAACGSPATSNVSGSVTVNAIPATPTGTITPTQNCGNTSLSYSAPSASLYWQTAPTGMSTAFPTTSAYSVTTNGTYYVRAFNGSCWSTGTVSQAVTVVNAIVISTQPSNQSTFVGSTATFSVTASNAAGYQWQINTGSGWSDISGATSASYTTPATTLAMSGYQYQVVVTGNAPCGNVTSSAAILTVTVAPCGTENFNNSNATASYTNNSFVGNNGVTWTYVQSRDENGDANGSGISGKALMLRNLASNSKVTSSTVTTGIENFSVTLYKGFTGAGSRQVELFVNGVSRGTSASFDDYNPHVFTVNGINVSGNVVIEIRNITGNQVIVDNISWTCYNSNSEIDVQGNSVSIADGDNTPSLTDDTNFGTTIIGNDIAHTFTIYNTGTDVLDVSGITITGVNAADFYISVNPASTVAAGGSTTFEVTFSPTVAGTSNATINIANNDADENPYTF
ncbi:MAG: choice-of-anchor D domain-containing protein, partial [Flavobacterium sp.]|nr:choice-of-anchor D domain-containing protein [Flavobacterium sp.]